MLPLIVSSDERTTTIDLRGVRALDSTALGQLVILAANHRKRGKSVKVLIASAAMQKVFHITGLTRHVDVEIRAAEAA